MKSIDFVIERLESLYSTIENINIRYEYRQTTSTHIIEITPKDIFDSNEDYIIYEEKIEGEFKTAFFDENILFISSESLTEIKDPFRSWGGIAKNEATEKHYSFTELYNFYESQFPEFENKQIYTLDIFTSEYDNEIRYQYANFQNEEKFSLLINGVYVHAGTENQELENEYLAEAA